MLPTDGSSPEAFLDQEVTARLATALPPAPGPLTVGLVDGVPRIVPSGTTAPSPPA